MGPAWPLLPLQAVLQVRLTAPDRGGEHRALAQPLSSLGRHGEDCPCASEHAALPAPAASGRRALPWSLSGLAARRG